MKNQRHFGENIMTHLSWSFYSIFLFKCVQTSKNGFYKTNKQKKKKNQPTDQQKTQDTTRGRFAATPVGERPYVSISFENRLKS